jgi:mannitol-1-/sugar-/sorbitol-6-/2-deoxyglucose-6-phosphatase
MPIEAVIFDMDGVLVDSEVYWIQARQTFAKTHGKSWTMDDHRVAMGRNTLEWAKVVQERLELHLDLDVIIAEIKQHLITHYEQRLPLLPGAIEAVKTAASAYPVALASGSPKDIIDYVMNLTGLDQVFQHVVYADDMTHGKPAPDVYLHTAKLLNVPPDVCVGIEDSPNGIRSLRAAGMSIIAVPSPGFPLADDVSALADVKLDSLEEFSLDLVRSLK